jgi:hypothetical protein
MSGVTAGCYTFKRRPLELIFIQEFPTREEALASEQRIKGWSRKKKEAMMRGDWAEVSRLAKSSSQSIQPERVEGACPEHVNKACPELVEGPPVHGSTGSPPTGTDEAISPTVQRELGEVLEARLHRSIEIARQRLAMIEGEGS